MTNPDVRYVEVQRETPSSAGIETDSKDQPKPSVKAYCEAGHLTEAVDEALAGYRRLRAGLGLPQITGYRLPFDDPLPPGGKPEDA